MAIVVLKDILTSTGRSRNHRAFPRATLSCMELDGLISTAHNSELRTQVIINSTKSKMNLL